MEKAVKKMLALLLAASMLLQMAGLPVMAEESGTEPVQTEADQKIESERKEDTQTETEAPETKAPETQAPEMKASETQAPETKAPETQAPETQKSTSAPESQPAQSHSETAASETQPGTEASQGQDGQSESQTLAPSAETDGAETEEESETEETGETEESREETESETDTEKDKDSESKNNGEKLTAAGLSGRLEAVLPYLAVAQQITAPEDMEKDMLLQGDEAGQALTDLSRLSREIARGRSSTSVQVINLYAGEDGKLDLSQLEEAYKDHVLDVSSRYIVINIVAASRDQSLNLSGFSMKYNGQNVTYEDSSRVGYVLYNFTALEGEEFTDYTGSLTWTASGERAGTILAPCAAVTISQGLDGAVYAGTAVLSGSADEYRRIVFIEGEEGLGLSETESETAPEENSETQAEETEAETEPTAETESEPAAETETGSTAETGTDYETESGTEMMAGADETETEAETAEAGETETEEFQPEDGSFLSGSEEEEVLNTVLEDTQVQSWYSQGGLSLQLKLADGEDTSRSVTGTVSLKAGEAILDQNGNTVYQKDQEVAPAYTFARDEAYNLGENLRYSGVYYIETTDVQENYLVPSRVYLVVNESGEVSADSTGGIWNGERTLLQIPVYRDSAAVSQVKVTLTGTDDQGMAVNLTGAFVVKDAQGNILKDGAGYPLYYINCTADGQPAVISGLAAGDYYLSQLSAQEGYETAADTMFTVEDGRTTEVAVTNERLGSQVNTLRLTARAMYGTQTLTAERSQTFYAALFSDPELTRKCSDVKTLTMEPGTAVSGEAVFSMNAAGQAQTYYLARTDAFGTPIDGQASYTWAFQNAAGEPTESVVFSGGTASEQTFVLTDTYSIYPSGEFSWEAQIHVTKQVLNREGSETPVTASFYIMLYGDQAHTQPLLAAPAELQIQESSSGETDILLKMTEAGGTVYAAETDEQGNLVVSGDKSFGYNVRFGGGTGGAVNVTAGTESSLSVINQQCTDTVVRIRVTNASGHRLSGASMVIKDSSGRVLDLNGQVLQFRSGSSDYVLTNQLSAGTYYLSQITAPSGYQASPDVEFTVSDGQTVEVVMTNQAVSSSSNGRITAYKQVYSGQHQLYAQDTSAGRYAAQGSYTFYAALFSDRALTQKVSDVQQITVSGFSGSTVFRNLEKGKTYYIAETDQYGQVLTSGSGRRITYTGSGRIHLGSGSAASGQVIIRNIYSSLPEGYRYTARLTLRKNVTDSAGASLSVSDTFYIGIYRTSNYSDTPTIVPITLENTSSGSATRRILLAGNSDVTYYFAEVDAQGNRVSGNDTFGYEVSMDQSSRTITRGAEAEVTVTNRERSSKVTLYLTKRVFEGAQPLSVSETFYAGLFRDENFTQLYTDPIPLTLNNSSAVTLRLSLSLGTAQNATIYIAEVDENGNLVRSSQEFGYDVRMMNARAAFDGETREVQTVLINSVYGTSTDDDWSSIYSMAGDGLDSSYISENGAVTSAAQTGDPTPIGWYLALFGISGGCLAAALYYRKSRKYR